jgi:hypothetical protein
VVVKDNTPRRWTRREINELDRLWRANVESGAIAQRLGRTRLSVIGKLHRIGSLGMEPERRRARDERIAERYRAGERADHLASIYSLSAKHVTFIARQYGVRRGAGRPRLGASA